MGRIPQLDGLRGIAILAVFMHHALKVKMLWMGVDLFFVLSGFLITGILLNTKDQSIGEYLAHFYSRRARRIVVPYLLALVVVSLIFGIAWARYWYFYIGLTNFILPLQIPQPVAFDPLWSLAVEEQFYVVWPSAVYFLSERHLGWLAGGMVLLAPVLRGVCHFQAHWPIYALTPFRMDLLAAGALICLAYRNRSTAVERWGAKAGLPLVLVGGAGLALLARFGVSTSGNTRTGNVLIYECALLASVGLMLWALSGWRVAVLRWSPLSYIGRISYTMYLVHLAVLTLLLAWMPSWQAAIAGLSVTVVYATASWYAIERPLLARTKA